MEDNNAGDHEETAVPPGAPQATQSRRMSLSPKLLNKRFSIMNVTQPPKPVLRYMATYRLEPRVPVNRETCEKVLKNVMDNTFSNYVYAPKYSLNICASASAEIRNRIKTYNFDRYRYVCVVTIGERVMQGFCSLVSFLWDAERDGYVSYVYETPNFFATATLYYVYYD